MDNGLQMLVNKLQRTIGHVKQLRLNLNSDFPNDEDSEESRLGIKW